MDDGMEDDDGVTRVEDSETSSWDGRRIHFATLLARRWGWPKLAAKRAAEFMQAQAAEQGCKAHLELSWEGRTAQQIALFKALPGLRQDLCTGLVARARRNSHHAGNQIKEVVIRFPLPITDDGLTLNVLAAVAGRLGCSVEDMRGRHCPVCARMIPKNEIAEDVNRLVCLDCESPTVKVTTMHAQDDTLTLEVMANLFEVLP